MWFSDCPDCLCAEYMYFSEHAPQASTSGDNSSTEHRKKEQKEKNKRRKELHSTSQSLEDGKDFIGASLIPVFLQFCLSLQDFV